MLRHSPLRRAIEKGCAQSVIAALDSGADLEERDIHGYSGLPLRIACFMGHARIVELLIARGVNVHARNEQGHSGAIRMAVRGRHHDIVKLLMSHGAKLPAGIQPPALSSYERRSRAERRRLRLGPPQAMRERRTASERRTLSMQEIALSRQEWNRYFSDIAGSASQYMPREDKDQEWANSVLERVRD